MNEQARRSIAGAVLPMLALAITLLAILDADSLPDPMASHWDLSGDPNDSIGRTTFFGLFFSLVFVTGLTSLWTSRRRDVRAGDLTPPVALATFMQWTFVRWSWRPRSPTATPPPGKTRTNSACRLPY